MNLVVEYCAEAVVLDSLRGDLGVDPQWQRKLSADGTEACHNGRSAHTGVLAGPRRGRVLSAAHMRIRCVQSEGQAALIEGGDLSTHSPTARAHRQLDVKRLAGLASSEAAQWAERCLR